MSRHRPLKPAWGGDAGGVGLLTVLGGMLTALVAVVIVASAADLVMTRHRATAAADAAALAAAGASPLAGGDGDPRAAAQRFSEANDAALDDLDDRDWPLRVTVRVGAEPHSRLLRPMLSRLLAESTGEVIPPAP